jgi:hypothetical protein
MMDRIVNHRLTPSSIFSLLCTVIVVPFVMNRLR